MGRGVAAGADVLYAPGLRNLEEIRLVCEAVNKPVNIVIEMREKPSMDALAEVGVARISVGAIFSRIAYGAMITAAREIRDSGDFTAIERPFSYNELEAFFLT